MADVVIYTGKDCPFSKKCKAFLEDKKVSFTEYNISADTDQKAEMLQKTGDRSDTPQVFINGHHIGSFDDLKALDAVGKLDGMLDIKS